MHLFGYIAFTDAFEERQYHPFRWIWKSDEVNVDIGNGQSVTADQSTWIELHSDADAQALKQLGRLGRYRG